MRETVQPKKQQDKDKDQIPGGVPHIMCKTRASIHEEIKHILQNTNKGSQNTNPPRTPS